jgi:hypothetical protein
MPLDLFQRHKKAFETGVVVFFAFGSGLKVSFWDMTEGLKRTLISHLY